MADLIELEERSGFARQPRQANSMIKVKTTYDKEVRKRRKKLEMMRRRK